MPIFNTKIIETAMKPACLIVLLLVTSGVVYAQRLPSSLKQIMKMDGLLAVWDFKEDTGSAREAYGLGKFTLQEENGRLTRISEGHRPRKSYRVAVTKNGS